MGWVADLRGHVVGLDTAPLIYFVEARSHNLPMGAPLFALIPEEIPVLGTPSEDENSCDDEDACASGGDLFEILRFAQDDDRGNTRDWFLLAKENSVPFRLSSLCRRVVGRLNPL